MVSKCDRYLKIRIQPGNLSTLLDQVVADVIYLGEYRLS